MTRSNPLTQYDADEICECAFTDMALELGFTIEEIEAALAKHRVASPFEPETVQ